MKKSEFLTLLQAAYRQWEAVLDQIGPARMDLPGVAGHWSIKDIVAHLTGWQRRLIARLQAALRNEPEPPPHWPAHLQAEDDINAWLYESNRGRSTRDVLDESHKVFQQTLAAVAGLPENVKIERIEPKYDVVWVGGERFAPGEFFYHFQGDHEPDVRAWLARVETL